MDKKILKAVIDIINILVDDSHITIDQIDEDLTKFGVDSLVFIRMILILEEEFKVEIPDEFLLITKMNTIRKIVDLIYSLSISVKGVKAYEL